jgi:type II secretory pathway pseudopilin PulG
MIRDHNNKAGFTLIELFIIVMILGILALITIPQVRVTSEETKLVSLRTNLTNLRAAIQLYYYQHNNTYPGERNAGGGPVNDPSVASTAFRRQLKRYTDINGVVTTTKDATHKYGPYIRMQTLPENPFSGNIGVKCDITIKDVTARTSDGTTGWKFYTRTGIFMANDGAHDHL